MQPKLYLANFVRDFLDGIGCVLLIEILRQHAAVLAFLRLRTSQRKHIRSATENSKTVRDFVVFACT